ncbi:MAG: hypothetical protein RJA99_56 [Pseudomonadota bacterium]|jgi:uncharacterized membrane protein
MIVMVLGLVLFLGVHSVRVFADDWRTAQIAARGEGAWKGVYSVLSLAGLVLIVYGYGLTRQAPVDLWNPPVWTRHLAALLTLPAFVLLAAAQVKGTRIKAAVGHPQVLGTKLWAFSHLIANGRLGDVVLFGAFLVWAIVLYGASRRRDRRTGTRHVAGPASRDAIAVVAGLAAWAAFAWWLHAWLIGVQPFA